MVAFRNIGRSMTGATYAALPYGPQLNNYSDLIDEIKKAYPAPDKKGFTLFFTGLSGAGKSTLLRMIAGLTEPTEGSIEIRGKSMIGIPPNKRPVNLIFQHLALFPMMTVEQNIAYGLKRRKASGAEIARKVAETTGTRFFA